VTFGEGRSKRPSRKKARAEKQEPAALTRQHLEQAALSYLNRFDCTASKLTRKLALFAKKAGEHADAAQWITELIDRYQKSGVLDDSRFARNLSSQLAARGKSARVISQKLSARGVPGEVTHDLLMTRKQEDPGAELEAARAYVRKRRLGPHRTPEKRDEYRQKDLASLARQGFSFDVARQALGSQAATDDEL